MAGLAAIRGTNQDSSVSVNTGSSLTAFITSEFSTPPDRSFALVGYESTTAEDLDNLGLEPTDTTFLSPSYDELDNSVPPPMSPVRRPGCR